jgi:hypothetical protein
MFGRAAHVSKWFGDELPLAAYEQMHRASGVPHRDVVTFVRDRNLYGRGAAWIDIHLLASAIVGPLHLWTADPRFAAIAKELGVAYETAE